MIKTFRFDANDQDGIVGIADVSDLLVGSFEVGPGAYTWSTAVLTVVYANGLGGWTAYPSVSTLTTSARASGRLDLSWVNMIALKITTPEGSSRPFEGVFNGHG